MVAIFPASSISRARALEREINELAIALHRKQQVRDIESRLNAIARNLGQIDVSPKQKKLREDLLAVAAAAGIFLSVATASNHVGNSRYYPAPLSMVLQTQASTGVRSEFKSIPNEVRSELVTQAQAKPIQKIDALMHAIIGQESNGKFHLVNPHSGALGYGQVMPENVKPWTLEALGYSLTAQEFLQSPNLQLKVIKYQLTKAYNSQSVSGRSEEEVLRRVASIWYSGQAKLWNNSRPQYYNGHLYPSVVEYTTSVYQRYQSEIKVTPDEVRSKPTKNTQSKSTSEVRIDQPIKTFGNLLLNFFNSKKAEVASTVSARSIIAYMESQGYDVFRNPGEVNIIHVRNGSKARDLFEDRRIIIQFVNGNPVITGDWAETTKPGLAIVRNPINPKGAFAIALGQYKAWQIGTHVGGSGRHAHEALIQTGAPVSGYRDTNGDGVFDAPDQGWFGINIHAPWSDGSQVWDRSAGCLVVAKQQDHQVFMGQVKKDPRFLADSGFVFTSTFIDGAKL